MEDKRLEILIGAARAKIKRAYERHHHQVLNFDPMVQAQLHCQSIIGIDLPWLSGVLELEELEKAYEELTGEIVFPRWRARRHFMEELIEAGAVPVESLDKAADFLCLIDERLSYENLNLTDQHMNCTSGTKFEDLLHPLVVKSSLQQFMNGQVRDAVLNAFVAIGDLLRERTNLSLDGKSLVEHALSLNNPKLILSELSTESGRSDQSGFMQIIAGAFTGIRNPKAHSLAHDLDSLKAMQYLVFASLIARRLSEAQIIEDQQG